MSDEAGQALSRPGEKPLASGQQPLFSHKCPLPVQSQRGQVFYYYYLREKLYIRVNKQKFSCSSILII